MGDGGGTTTTNTLSFSYLSPPFLPLFPASSLMCPGPLVNAAAFQQQEEDQTSRDLPWLCRDRHTHKQASARHNTVGRGDTARGTGKGEGKQRRGRDNAGSWELHLG